MKSFLTFLAGASMAFFINAEDIEFQVALLICFGASFWLFLCERAPVSEQFTKD